MVHAQLHTPSTHSHTRGYSHGCAMYEGTAARVCDDDRADDHCSSRGWLCRARPARARFASQPADLQIPSSEASSMGGHSPIFCDGTSNASNYSRRSLMESSACAMQHGGMLGSDDVQCGETFGSHAVQCDATLRTAAATASTATLASAARLRVEGLTLCAQTCPDRSEHRRAWPCSPRTRQ